jgi:hypothetical protein
MRKRFVRSLAVVFLTASIFPAMALGRTSVLTASRCNPGCSELVGVYKVRPRHIVLIEAYGGGLTLHWKHWGMYSATGVGTSSSAGTGAVAISDVKVRLERRQGDHFTLMRIRFTHAKVHDVESGQVTAIPGRRKEVLQESFEYGPEWTPVGQGG